MSPRTQIIAIIGVLFSLALIIELVRRRKLRTGYSLLWLFIGLVVLILVLFQDMLVFFSQLLGIQLPISLLFTAGIVFALLILLEHSLTLSTLWRQNKEQAQEQAMLEWQIRQLQSQLEKVTSAAPDQAEPTTDPPEGQDL